MSLKCIFCSAELTYTAGSKLGFQEECPKCLRDLHCCKMCQFYHPQSYNECKESSAERVVDKEKKNYCDYFILGDANSGKPEQDAMSAAEALFKK